LVPSATLFIASIRSTPSWATPFTDHAIAAVLHVYPAKHVTGDCVGVWQVHVRGPDPVKLLNTVELPVQNPAPGAMVDD
jgi:hypothetical protein